MLTKNQATVFHAFLEDMASGMLSRVERIADASVDRLRTPPFARDDEIARMREFMTTELKNMVDVNKSRELTRITTFYVKVCTDINKYPSYERWYRTKYVPIAADWAKDIIGQIGDIKRPCDGDYTDQDDYDFRAAMTSAARRFTEMYEDTLANVRD